MCNCTWRTNPEARYSWKKVDSHKSNSYVANVTYYNYFLNQACAWFPEIVFRKSVCVCMYICLSFRTYMSKPFT